jgi:hypothetical protein
VTFDGISANVIAASRTCGTRHLLRPVPSVRFSANGACWCAISAMTLAVRVPRKGMYGSPLRPPSLAPVSAKALRRSGA